jgi:hypothetical protein
VCIIRTYKKVYRILKRTYSTYTWKNLGELRRTYTRTTETLRDIVAGHIAWLSLHRRGAREARHICQKLLRTRVRHFFLRDNISEVSRRCSLVFTSYRCPSDNKKRNNNEKKRWCYFPFLVLSVKSLWNSPNASVTSYFRDFVISDGHPYTESTTCKLVVR